jgi:alpha-glucosidase
MMEGHEFTIDDPPRFELVNGGQHPTPITLRAHDCLAMIYVLEQDIIRVVLLPHGKWMGPPRTYSVAPGLEDCPDEGFERQQEMLINFTCPLFLVESTESTLTVTTQALRLCVKLTGFICSWERKGPRGWEYLATDRVTQPYNFGWWSGGPQHYLARSASERYVGLGEVSGKMDRKERRIRLSNTDAMGYDAKVRVLVTSQSIKNINL